MEFLLQILLEITKTIAREGIVFGFKKLTAKKRLEDFPPVCLRSVGSLLSANKL
ncbi:hypothetical protein V7652_07700 [Bacillus thuringiensis]|uniref:hypothetical protein n=1 Tax=Bacillus thuringiensis TaxID=1428 RepID=UPI00148385BE|nr:hypothetical protein [Bacillus thuringiensis]MED3272387.1 hypothetical protein [Bacillus thuringiensis]